MVDCLEINLLSLTVLLLFLSAENMPWLFLGLINSQLCEEFFRRTRSLTTQSSTMINASVAAMFDRFYRISKAMWLTNELQHLGATNVADEN